jgi:hypothetical protein
MVRRAFLRSPLGGMITSGAGLPQAASRKGHSQWFGVKHKKCSKSRVMGVKHCDPAPV